MICGPIYTIADIFEDPQFHAREMLVNHEDPEFGTYVGPGDRAEVLRHAPRGPLVGDLGGGRHNRRVYGGLLGPLRRPSSGS